jgi:nucleoside-diphosphate-sugar epimerase
MASVIVTGGSGFLGTAVVALLRADGTEAWNLDVADPRDPSADAWHVRVDIMDRAALGREFGRIAPDSVCHLAARTDIDGTRVEEYAVNTEGTRNVLDAAKAVGVRRLLLASSQLVNPLDVAPEDESEVAPPNAYGASKVEAERIVRADSGRLEWVIVRPTSIWGPWFGVKYQGLFRSVRRGLYMHPSGRRIRKAWGYVGNAASDLMRLLEADGAAGRTLYLADAEPYDLLEFAEEIRRAWGAPRIRQVPLPLLRAVAAGGDAAMSLGMRFPLHSYRLANLLTDMRVRTEPLRRLCGPQPFTVQQGVRDTVAWMRANPDFSRDVSLH